MRRKGYPTQTKVFRTRREAADWAAIIESEMVRGMFTPRTEADRTTLGERFAQRLGAAIWCNGKTDASCVAPGPMLVAAPLLLALADFDGPSYESTMSLTPLPLPRVRRLPALGLVTLLAGRASTVFPACETVRLIVAVASGLPAPATQEDARPRP